MAKHLDPTRADAKDRAKRTALQALGLDLLAAIGVCLSTWVVDADIATTAAWTALAAMVGKSCLQVVAAYLMRLKVAPAGAEGAPEPEQGEEVEAVGDD